jgi:hypothetical protein
VIPEAIEVNARILATLRGDASGDAQAGVPLIFRSPYAVPERERLARLKERAAVEQAEADALAAIEAERVA